MPDSCSIGDLAGEFGVTPRTLRFYEDQGLLHPGRAGKARIFSARDRARLSLILRGKRLGFSLAEIKEMLDLYDLGDDQVEQLRLTQQKIRERIAQLEGQRADIESTLKELNDADVEVRRALSSKGVMADAV
jgi:DNA-binding transcriptional MerR regulator